MKIKFVVLSAVLVIAVTACEQKPGLADKTTATGNGVSPPAQQITKEPEKKAQEDAGHAVAKVESTGEKKPAVKEKKAPSSVAVMDSAPELTESQLLKQRRQKAEDEMTMELAKRK